ncbi:MAG: IclR family transcriptional regulator [Deltaproteobacteria bacterium]|nr:IclR family transcriptional regulator [Deltaproteobacteria bacterium]
MSANYKRVPAVDKCFSILELIARSRRPLGFTEIVRELGLNKSTVFNLLHTLNDLGILDKGADGLFHPGSKLFILGNAAARGSELIQIVHPCLVNINNEFRVSAFLGILSGTEVIIIDKADMAQKVKVSSEIGMKIPLFAGVAGKALLSQLPGHEVTKIINKYQFKKYTPNTNTDKGKIKKEIMQVRATGLAYDMEEYIEGLVAVAVPIKTGRDNLQAVIWAVGLKQEFRDSALKEITDVLMKTAAEINSRFL